MDGFDLNGHERLDKFEMIMKHMINQQIEMNDLLIRIGEAQLKTDAAMNRLTIELKEGFQETRQQIKAANERTDTAIRDSNERTDAAILKIEASLAASSKRVDDRIEQLVSAIGKLIDRLPAAPGPVGGPI